MLSTHSHRVAISLPGLATALVVAMVLAYTAERANAVPDYLTAFETQYPAAVGSRIDTCNVCHTTVPALNPYGTAFQAAGHEFAPIESADSDGDGFSNLAEIMALTFPGDPADTPGPAPSETPTVTVVAETATPTVTAAANDTPTATPSGAAVQTPTNTSAGPTVTPTTPGASPTTPIATPTNRPGTPTATPSRGSATVSPTTSAAATATRAVSPTTSAARTATSGGRPHFADSDSCSIVAPERTSAGGGLALLLLTPALLVWARRRRL